MKSIIRNVSIALLLIFQFAAINSSANNLDLGTTVTVVSGDQISFTIKWDNSWYAPTAPNNWDAVWVFIKYKDCATTDWQHATLSTTSTDHSVAGGDTLLSVEMPAVNDGKGVLIRRTATGSGNITSAETVTLKLNGIATGSYNFKVFGMEMVKVVNEDFEVGDGAASYGFNSVTISSEAAITSAVLGGTSTVDLLAAYPKGWEAFYSMKYEVSEQQYMEFLNCLTYDQQATRTVIGPNAVRGNKVTKGRRKIIGIDTSGVESTTPAVYGCDWDNDIIFNETNDGQNVAMNGISWADLAAYLDWACLRPMTGLEYEKICRGPLSRVVGEFPWGNTIRTNATGSGTPSGLPSEVPSNTGEGLCIVWVGGSSSVLRVGSAASTTTTRSQAGAGYYGVLDLAGNAVDRIVGTHAGGGDTFTGVLGDGALDATGDANQANWPGTNAVGVGCRGGSFGQNPGIWNETSNRSYARTNDASRTTNNECFGGRGVR